MQNIFLNIDSSTSVDELEKVIKYNIGRASILRDNIKELDRVEQSKAKAIVKSEMLSSEIEVIQDDESEQQEYIYYYHNIQEELKNITSYEETVDAIRNTLPSRENKNYFNIVSRIKLELLKEIHELDIMLTEEEVKSDLKFKQDIDEEKSRLYEIINAINYLQTEKVHEQIEEKTSTDNKLVFLETPSGSIYAENDLYSIPEEYYEVFKNLLLSIKDGTFKNAKMFNSAHQTLGGMSEVKDFKTRIVFDRIGKDTYIIISIFTKKCDMDNSYRESLSNRVSYYKKNRDYLVEMLQDNEFIEKNKSIETELLKGLETKNLVKTIKGGSKYDK